MADQTRAAGVTTGRSRGARPGGLGPRAVLVAVALGLLLGLLILIAPRWLEPSARPLPATTLPQVSLQPSHAPTQIRIRDEGATVTVSWLDHSQGRAPYVVIGGPWDTTPALLAQVPRGTATATINGLDDATDYCFTVLAVFSVDDVAASERVCTHRRERPKASHD